MVVPTNDFELQSLGVFSKGLEKESGLEYSKFDWWKKKKNKCFVVIFFIWIVIKMIDVM